MTNNKNAFVPSDESNPTRSMSSTREEKDYECCFLPKLSKAWQAILNHVFYGQQTTIIESDTESETTDSDCSSTESSSGGPTVHPAQVWSPLRLKSNGKSSEVLFRGVYVHGHRVGNYLCGETLGEGSFGSVRLATTIRGKRKQVAIKSIKKPGKGMKEEDFQTLLKEAQIMRLFGQHPNICGLLDSMRSKDRFYMVMPRATTDLFDVMEDDHILQKQPDFVQTVARPILSAMTALHECGVAHLDVKLENVLVFTSALDEKMRLRPGHYLESKDFKLADFGLSRTYPYLAVTNPVGTPAYLAPELIHRFCLDGRTADMWAVGVILLMLRHPEMRDQFAHLGRLFANNHMKRHSRSLKLLLSSLVGCYQVTKSGDPDNLFYNLVLGLLRRDEKQRLTASEALKHPWFQVSYDRRDGSSKLDRVVV